MARPDVPRLPESIRDELREEPGVAGRHAAAAADLGAAILLCLQEWPMIDRKMPLFASECPFARGNTRVLFVASEDWCVFNLCVGEPARYASQDDPAPEHSSTF